VKRAALILALALEAGLAPAVAADAAPARILGNWLTEPRDGVIQISLTPTGTYEGRIVGGNHPGRLDANNPDPARRNQPLRGQLILRNLHYDGGGKWSGGSIYDPDSGHTYKCRIELLDPDRLRVRGFIGVALLGRSQIWTRYLGTSMDLPAAAP
jgi:uncharacterized protein (DUF2147 family)